jgi:hypothetical protein
MNHRTGFQLVAAAALLAAGLLVAPAPGYADTQGKERREDRRDTRDDARDAKDACKDAGGDRSDCRQEKRDVKR